MRIGNELMARKEEIGELVAREEGKTLLEGIGEAVRAAQIFKFFGAETLRLNGEILTQYATVSTSPSLAHH